MILFGFERERNEIFMNYKKDEFEEEDQTDNFSFCSYTVLFIIKI